MPETYCLYVDDSGTRLPDKKVLAPGEVNWFGLGGVLLSEADEGVIRSAHAELYEKWPEIKGAPLHSHKIRMAKGPFSFFSEVAALGVRSAFMNDLSKFILESPVLGHAVVIHRPGYMARYEDLYGEKRWLPCKTAFSVLLERASKFALTKNAKLRVYVEKTDRDTDARMTAYYTELRANGMPFKSATSAKYQPLAASELKATLYDLKFKDKTSPLIQLADLYLFPICKAGYKIERPYSALVERKRVIDSILQPEEVEGLGVKYSCFDTELPACRASLAPSERS